MTITELSEKLIGLAEKATPGEWYDGTVQVYQTNHITRDIWNIAGPPKNTLRNNWQKDRAYIAAANPKTIKRLAQAVLEMRYVLVQIAAEDMDQSKRALARECLAKIERVE